MSKRNVILLISVLAVIIIVVFGVLYFYQPKNKTGVISESINFLADFLPFGKNETTAPLNGNSPADVSGIELGNEIGTSVLKKVSSFPVAGFGVFKKERFKDVVAPDTTNLETLPSSENQAPKLPVAPASEFAPALRYVNKATGNIYQTFADKLDERKFSSTIIPRVYEAFFGNNGESVIMRYLKADLSTGQADNRTIETFVGVLPKEYLGADSIGTNDIKGSFLPENISDLSVSADTSKIFYLFNIGNSATGITFSLQTGTKIQVFDSPFTEWLSLWPNNKMITISTKPSARVPGYVYAINPDKKDFNKILGGINGLTTLMSPDGKMVLYSDSDLSLRIFNISTKNSNLLGIKTLPEKCVWGMSNDVIYCSVPKYINQAEYPDSWYQGETSFSDEIWKIDAQTGNSSKILDPASENNGEEIDGIKLNLDENQNYLFFINKKDSYLWELQLK